MHLHAFVRVCALCMKTGLHFTANKGGLFSQIFATVFQYAVHSY